MRTYVILAGCVLLLSLIVSFLPASQYTAVSEGVDSYATHRLLFGRHIFSQEVELSEPLEGVGAILVDIRRTGNPSNVHVAVKTINENETLATATIPSTQIIDDAFARTEFDEPISPTHKHVRLEFSAPDATLETAIGVRFDPKDTRYTRYENEHEQAGIFAVELKELVPLWRSIVSFIAAYDREFKAATVTLLVLLVFVLLTLPWLWKSIPYQHHSRVQIAIICVLAVIAFGVRMHAERMMGGVSGGDPYNYLMISQRLYELENPFAGSKRLPGYPLLLVPAIANLDIDVHTYMRTISSLAAVGSIILIYLIARALTLSWPVSLGAASLLAFHKDFFETSLRPEPYTLYTLLLLLSIYLFLIKKTWWQDVALGIAMGYAAMTRQEGFVLAVIFFISSVTREVWYVRKGLSTIKQSIILLCRTYVPAFLLVLPFFLHSAIAYGNPIYTPYFKGERLQIIDSYIAFQDASVATWAILTSMWKASWVQLEEIRMYDSRIVPLALFALLGWSFWQYHKRKISHSATVYAISGLSLAVLAWTVWLLATDPPKAAKLFPFIVTGFLVAAPCIFLYQTGVKGVFISIILTSQILIALWFHPFPKHYQQSYPLICLALACALFPTVRQPLLRSTTYALFALPFIGTGYLLFNNLHVFVDSHNAATALDSVTYRAVREMRTHEGPYGVDGLFLPTFIYLPRDSYTDITRSESTLDGINALVDINEIGTAVDIPQDWQEVAVFKSEGKDEVLYESRVYIRP